MFFHCCSAESQVDKSRIKIKNKSLVRCFSGCGCGSMILGIMPISLGILEKTSIQGVASARVKQSL